MKLDKIFDLIEVESLENGFQEYIELWTDYYKGFVPDFHAYKEWNGAKNAERKLRSLGMAKKVCEDYADFIYNPETKIVVDDSYQERLDEILEKTNFEKEINFNIEKGYALGTLGIVTTIIDGEPTIQMATADMMYPIVDDYSSGWAIISEYRPNIYYISVHYNEIDNKYRVDNYVIDFRENENGEVITEDVLQSEYNVLHSYEYEEPMLHIIKPAIANNKDFTTPYGISIYGNALDELQTVDIAYSSLSTELKIGKMLKFGMISAVHFNEDGAVFPDEEGYYIDPKEGDKTFSDGTTVKTHSPTLRTQEMINTLETNLNLLGRKCGLGDNAYSFEEGTIYTNTAQVVSTNSKFYRTRQKHLVIVEEALVSMVRALYLLDRNRQYTGDVSVEFDDSIIHDKEQEDKELNYQYSQGLISEVYYWQVKLGLTEDLAIEFVNRQNELKGLIEMPDDEGGEV